MLLGGSHSGITACVTPVTPVQHLTPRPLGSQSLQQVGVCQLLKKRKQESGLCLKNQGQAPPYVPDEGL